MGKDLFFPGVYKSCVDWICPKLHRKSTFASFTTFIFFLASFLLLITFFARLKDSLHSKYCITAIFTCYATCTFISFKSPCLILFQPQPLLLSSSSLQPFLRFSFSFTSVRYRSRDRPLQKSLCPCMSARCGLSQCIYHNGRELFIYGQLVCPWRYKRPMARLY